MENIIFWEYSQYLLNTGLYLKENSLSIALIFFIILFCVYFYLYLKEYEKNKFLEEDKKFNEFILEIAWDSLSKLDKNYHKLREQNNRQWVQIQYYKKRYFALQSAINENFWNNKAVLNLIKWDFNDFLKKSMKELIENDKNKLEKKQKQI